jgi:major membrane immunogen (membrane-anchored lipoprotein)
MSRRRLVAASLACLVSLGLLAACGGDDGGSGSRRVGTPDGTETPDSGADAYVGLTKQAAIARADAAGTPWRITREDDESFMVTQDYEPDRLNFEIDDGKVTRATYG